MERKKVEGNGRGYEEKDAGGEVTNGRYGVIVPYFADIQQAVGIEKYFGQFVVTEHFS